MHAQFSVQLTDLLYINRPLNWRLCAHYLLFLYNLALAARIKQMSCYVALLRGICQQKYNVTLAWTKLI